MEYETFPQLIRNVLVKKCIDFLLGYEKFRVSVDNN